MQPCRVACSKSQTIQFVWTYNNEQFPPELRESTSLLQFYTKFNYIYILLGHLDRF